MTAKKPSHAARSAPPRDGELTGDAAGTDAPLRVITDPRTMRALAHPVRLALLEALLREGELTATRASELLDESPGNMSWHLQTLAKYGYVEEAGGGKGRSRPWRVTADSNRFQTVEEDPQSAAAGDALASLFVERSYARLREWWSRRASYPKAWQDAAFISDSITYLTADEMAALANEINELFGRYRDRRLNKDLRPADAEPVKLAAFGHPLPPTPSGN
ncbi:MAG TPA: helix-turn-helix domain-containing protein [Solirubrobacteraceae bacterium]|jgi:DNA-binding transcriptional ArsR family regulator|nr:helix-turn-helix domain-containing protein [Solirubrobacteraceae bacterium]